MVRLRHDSPLDHGVDDATEVLGAHDVPVSEHGRSQHPILEDGVVPQPEAELLARDMVGVGIAEAAGAETRLMLEKGALDGVVEPLADEVEGLDRVRTRLLEDRRPVDLAIGSWLRSSASRSSASRSSASDSRASDSRASDSRASDSRASESRASESNVSRLAR